MAMGLGRLGPGRRGISMGLLHVVGAAAGGAATGALMGGVGAVLSLDDYRPWIVGATALVAFAISLARRPVEIGRRCQVPREWGYEVPMSRRYLLWGALLGSGVATLVPHSVFIAVIGVQAVIGPLLGAAAGALFGAGREIPAIMTVVRSASSEAPSHLLHSLAPAARRANALLALAGGLALLLLSL